MVPTTDQTDISTSHVAIRLKSSKLIVDNEKINTSGSVNEILAKDTESARNLALFLQQQSL